MRNREAFISIALSNNEKSFNDFLNIINTSIFESIKQEGKRNTGDKNFFWSTFANEYPALYKTIDKIRVYRNKAHHSELDQKNSRLYYEYLKEDLKGQFVEFVDGGYEFLQCKLTAAMYDNLRNILMVNAT